MKLTLEVNIMNIMREQAQDYQTNVLCCILLLSGDIKYKLEKMS